MRRCVYCGGLTGGKLACRAHADLPALDPFYNHLLREATTGHWSPPARLGEGRELVPT